MQFYLFFAYLSLPAAFASFHQCSASADSESSEAPLLGSSFARSARARHSRNRTLWELYAKTAANLEQEESVYREMVRRFPDQPKYQITLGEIQINRGDHARAEILTALMAGQALTATELAELAGITKQTASTHLAWPAVLFGVRDRY